MGNVLFYKELDKNGKEKNIKIYPSESTPEVEETIEKNVKILMTYAVKMHDDHEKEKEEKKKKKIITEEKEEKVITVFISAINNQNMVLKETCLRNSDLVKLKNGSIYIDQIDILASINTVDVHEAIYKWKLNGELEKALIFEEDLGLYQGIKKFCMANKLKFENKSVEFLCIEPKVYRKLKKQYRYYKDLLASKVWYKKMGNLVLPVYTIDYSKNMDEGWEEPEYDEYGVQNLLALKKDVKDASVLLTDEEVRYLVDTYYQIQEYRKATKNQARLLDSVPEDEPHKFINMNAKNFEIMERNIKTCLEVYVRSKTIGRWMMSIYGIGPVISAGLMANIDISKVESAGSIMRFAGMDPTEDENGNRRDKRIKGQKSPFNGNLKTLCWKIGESFQKVCNKPNDVYGKIYKKRFVYETENNEKGLYKEQALKVLEEKHFDNKVIEEIYKSGKLPPGHIISRAKRYAVKIFISHLFSVWYELDRGELPPKPYALAILNHKESIEIPNWRTEYSNDGIKK